MALEPKTQTLGILKCVILTDVFLESLRADDHKAARNCFEPCVGADSRIALRQPLGACFSSILSQSFI
ncbi:MAG: hypothetical protein ACJAR9_000506 [Celeribacter sp.]|jgi:hypothetical protein